MSRRIHQIELDDHGPSRPFTHKDIERPPWNGRIFSTLPAPTVELVTEYRPFRRSERVRTWDGKTGVVAKHNPDGFVRVILDDGTELSLSAALLDRLEGQAA